MLIDNIITYLVYSVAAIAAMWAAVAVLCIWLGAPDHSEHDSYLAPGDD
jgi:hypothetical protein